MELAGRIKSRHPMAGGVGVGRPFRYARKIEVIDEKELYKNPISVYDTAPNTTLSVTEFETFALARLKALRIIERINLTSVDKFSDNWAKAIETAIRNDKLDEFTTVLFTLTSDDEEKRVRAREFDHISHFLLRLAYAGTEEKRRWFIMLETDMFRLKFSRLLGGKSLHSFLKECNFPGKLVSDVMKKKYATEICNAFGGGVAQHNNLLQGDIFKIPFDMALDLVKMRKVFLLGGYAYVPFNEIVSVICARFRSHLSESMSMMKKNMEFMEPDERIIQVITDFDRRHTGNDYNNKKGNTAGIAAEELPILSQKSFPLCMKSLYDVVVKDHHLKHFGRLQLGLFLKAIGVPMEEATKFWRGHFTKKPEIDGSRFDKQYLYNIRHMYGHEGKRADYTPYSCLKVINSNVGPGDFHGCPFRHSDNANLRSKLLDAQIPQTGVKEITDLVEKHHYQIACQKYFEYTHDSMTVDGGVNHPNQYFEESRDVLSGKKTLRAAEKVPVKHVKIYPEGHNPDSQNQTQASSSSPDDPFDMDVEDEDIIQQYLADNKY